MSPQSDLRRRPGARVHALEIHVTSEAECVRRYGSNKKTKLVSGCVVEVQVDRSGQRANCFLLIDFDIGGGCTKRKRLNIRSVKAGDVLQQCSTQQAPFEQPVVPQTTRQPHQHSIPRQDIERDYNNCDGQQQPNIATQAGMHNAHGTLWEPPNAREDEMDVGGRVLIRNFGIRTVTGETICSGSDYSQRRPIDYFLMLFPPRQLREMVRLTSKELSKLPLSNTSPGELLKFIGVLMLCTRYEFGERRSLWSKEPPAKYMPAPNFGKTGMTRSRFDSLFRCLRFSEQAEERGQLSSEQHRWQLVDDFVTRFNEHRESYVIPGELICVDESISRWYGQGGDWINHGLPMYVAIDRKPENGCEIQNSACGLTGIMIRLKLVRTAQEEDAHLIESDEGLLHGTMVTKELVHPWSQSDRIVCADSYFASVGAARELKKMGLRFIGVVKTATKHFPMEALSSMQTTTRGESRCLVEKVNGKVELMALMWVDRNRRYFILSASSRAPGTPYTRKRWRQVDDRPNAPPERLELTVPQPKAAEIYYSACSQIDRHNRCRQADLGLERKIGTMDWSRRVNMSLLGMCIVDSYLAFKACKGSRCFMTQRQFYNLLTTELIDNSYDLIGSRDRQDAVKESATVFNGVPRSGIDVHLTPTKRRRTSNGTLTTSLQQGKCRVCKKKTTKECSLCCDDNLAGWICDTKRGKECFAVDLNASHDI